MSRLKVALVLVSIAVAATGGALSARRHYKPLIQSHARSRTIAIMSQAAQRDFAIVVLGDSIVELADVQDLCGKPTLNAGISGARVADVEDLAEQLIPSSAPASSSSPQA